MYIVFFPSMVHTFALVLKSYSCCYQNNNNANNDNDNTNRSPGSAAKHEPKLQEAWFWSQLSYLQPWDLGQLLFPSLSLSVLLKMERIIIPTCRTVLRIKTALYICPNMQKTL